MFGLGWGGEHAAIGSRNPAGLTKGRSFKKKKEENAKAFLAKMETSKAEGHVPRPERGKRAFGTYFRKLINTAEFP